jgi:hypothetical protein
LGYVKGKYISVFDEVLPIIKIVRIYFPQKKKKLFEYIEIYILIINKCGNNKEKITQEIMDGLVLARHLCPSL